MDGNGIPLPPLPEPAGNSESPQAAEPMAPAEQPLPVVSPEPVAATAPAHVAASADLQAPVVSPGTKCRLGPHVRSDPLKGLGIRIP